MNFFVSLYILFRPGLRFIQPYISFASIALTNAHTPFFNMKYEIALLSLASVASARDVAKFWGRMGPSGLVRREVPQEHSHEAILRAANTFLKLDNPLEIQDAVFALLGNAAAAAGAPNVANLNCLQQIVADQAFTNAKAAGDLDGQINAILFRAIEKNTLTVGELSVNCDEAAVNPEIDALQQHQDPAAAGATEINAAIELAAAVQIASIGGDPLIALQSATFAPGEVCPFAPHMKAQDANNLTDRRPHRRRQHLQRRDRPHRLHHLPEPPHPRRLGGRDPGRRR